MSGQPEGACSFCWDEPALVSYHGDGIGFCCATCAGDYGHNQLREASTEGAARKAKDLIEWSVYWQQEEDHAE